MKIQFEASSEPSLRRRVVVAAVCLSAESVINGLCFGIERKIIARNFGVEERRDLLCVRATKSGELSDGGTFCRQSPKDCFACYLPALL